MTQGRKDFPYGDETALTCGLNAVIDALEGKEPSFPYGGETALTAGINAVLARLGAGGVSEGDKRDIAEMVREGMTDGDLAEW